LGQAKKFSTEIEQGVKRTADVLPQATLEGLRRRLDAFIALVQQVIRQTKARVFGGNTRSESKLVSIFEPQTEIIRKGKASKPTEFGKMVKIQEAEHQIIIAYEVYDLRPNDKYLFVPAVQVHEQRLDRTPALVAGDAGFYSAQGEAEVQNMGVKRVSIPNHSTKSSERRRHQKQPWFRKGQKWRTGCSARRSPRTKYCAAGCRHRSPYALVNEGARILEEGIALRAVDIDIIYVNGYGFPSYRGGPMWYADTVGLNKVYERISDFHRRYGELWEPAPVLKSLAASGKTFAEFTQD
jgi:hypothetical protein